MHLEAYARDVATVSRDHGESGRQQGVRQTDQTTETDQTGSMDCDDNDCADEDDEVSADLALEDAVPKDMIEATADERTLTALYDDPAVIRYTVQRLYDTRRLSETHETTLIRLRTLYLMNEIDEAAWRRRLFTAEHNFERDGHISRVIRIYLMAVRDLQRQLARGRRMINDVEERKRCVASLLQNQRALAKMCNESLASLREEYGGPMISLRENVDDPDVPPICMM